MILIEVDLEGDSEYLLTNMKSHRLYSSALVVLVAVCIFSSAEGGTQGDDFLDLKERQVAQLKEGVEMNHRRQCDLLPSCGGPLNCSRNSCWPLLGDAKNLKCQVVKNNTYCPASNGACQSKNFDFTKSYVRMAPTTDIKSAVTTTIICSHRGMDVVFKDVPSPTSLSRAFFGSVDGTYIHFPGTDQSAGDCRKYDPRVRPWYHASTSVTKAVMILVDAAASMGKAQPTPLEGTFFATAKAHVFELLNTMSENDYVNIITFDSSKATLLAPSPVGGVYHNTGDSTHHPEFEGLKSNLSSMEVENTPGSSNITLGITAALANFANFTTSLKILVVFTDGDAATLKNGSLATLKGSNVKVFIFKLPQKEDPNRFLVGTRFLLDLRHIGGSFNVITWEGVNPLYSVQAYFSFLATVRAGITGHANDYSSIYEDYEDVVDQIFSISKPVFADDGKLLGVVGLNVFMNGLGNITDQVKEALLPRTLGKAFDPTKFVLTAANASIQSEDNPVLPCASSISMPLSAGLCTRTDTESKIQDLACCDACAPSQPRTSHSPNIKTIGIAVGAGIAFLVILICSILYYCWRTSRKDVCSFTFPGDAHRVEDKP